MYTNIGRSCLAVKVLADGANNIEFYSIYCLKQMENTAEYF